MAMTDDAEPKAVLQEVLLCARHWEPLARIIGNVRAGDIARAIEAALSTQPQAGEPVAWVIPGDDNARDSGFLDAMAWQEGEFTRPLYAAPPTASEPVAVKALEDRVEDIAKWLHDEVEWPEYDFPDHSWPDHPDDDGKRGNGYLKIIPRSSADQFREIARRILSLVSPALPSRGELEEAFAERAIAAIKEISNPDNGLRDKFVMTGPGGILVMACNAVRAALGSRT